MKKSFVIRLIFIFAILGAILVSPGQARSASCGDSCSDKTGEAKNTCLSEVTQACEAKLAETSTTKKSLQSALSYLNSQISYTQSQINKTAYEIEQLEEQILELVGKIDILNANLEGTTKLLLNRIAATYKSSKINTLTLFFSSKGFSEFISRYRYLRTAQANDRRVMFDLEQARSNYDIQKTLKEEKQNQVIALQKQHIAQKTQLASQQAAKSKLLEETKNDEKRYQELLSQARAEYEAIQNVLAGGGVETEVGDVHEGDMIARIIPSSSCNSSGAHLHFTVTEGNEVKNPFSYLRSIDSENCSGSSCGSTDGDPFNPGGEWIWPIDSRVKFTQGYGDTWAIDNTWVGSIYSFHNGIDIYNESLSIKAVKNGKLYRGSYVGGGGCTLRYVKVKHTDGGFETYYLHVNYL